MNKQAIEERYQDTTWGQYAPAFSSITTVFQIELYREAVKYLKGDVVDIGCGSAKLAAYLSDRPGVDSYTGIDANKLMLEVAKGLLADLGKFPCRLLEGRAEEVAVTGFNSAVSINSYYSWAEPRAVLQRIKQSLEPGAVFVLATPNPDLDMAGLLKEAKKSLLGHPYFDYFEKANIMLAGNEKANFVAMDELLLQLHSAGFLISKCHQEFFNGGLNFVISTKDA